ncbi:MAG: hypothetical protein MRK01_09225 [Candidatus Scalindua sp.]|nr:hypothetical protein [Candidatus Scalindua sp.]
MPAFTLNKKLFITFFLILMGIAFGISCLNFCERTGFSPRWIIDHYNGNSESVHEETEYEYNEHVYQDFPKSYREILEITHVHAFMIPLMVFVMSRILSMTDIREGVKIMVYSTAFAGTVMNVSGPYLIRFKSGVFSLSLLASYIVLGLCFITCISLSLWVMWFKKTGRNVEYWL